MASQPETSTYPAGIYQIETTDLVQGGIGGLSNAPLLQLANRTNYLLGQTAALATSLANEAPGSVTTITASGTLTTAEAGLILINAAGGNITVSLPAANALGAGFRTAYEFVRIDASANTVTLLAAGTDKFAINSTSSYAMSAGETLFSSSDGISKWYSLIDILGGVFAGIISATAVGGTGNAITGTLAGVSAYPSTLVAFTATSTNTGAVTINLSSLGVLSVLQDGIALSGGEIVAGAKYFGLVVGSSFNLIGSTAGPINVAPATAASHALQLSQAAAAYGPKPTGSAGVGQFLALSMPAGSITLPAGGTWAWFFIDLTNTAAAFGSAGVSAGGTVIFTGTVSCAGGFCWRIA